MAVTAALVAAAVGPMGAATASAKTVTAADDTAAEFAQGTPSATVVRTLTAADGAVELARTLEEQFNGDVLPSGWISTAWPSGGATTVALGAMVVNGARADSGVPAGPGSSLEFTATLGTSTYTHVGFATDFDQQPWAMFSTGADGGGKVYARTSAGPAPLENINLELPGIVATDPHLYRIDWTAAGFDYYVDGTLKATHTMPLTSMRPQASDYNAGDGGVSVASMVLNTHVTPGTFISRVLDAADPRVTGLSFTATSDTPSGTTIAYETRTAASSGALATAPWAPVGAGNTVTSPARQYLQYRATMTTSTVFANPTPRLDKVEIGFTVDNEAPVVTIDDVAVAGGTAKVTFSTNDAAADLKCKLDAAAFAACGSPKEFSGLAVGSHAVVVQATDAQGNVGSATRTFEVAAPPSGTTPPPSGGGTTPPPTGTTPDLTAPRVRLIQRTVRVSKGGIARIRVNCPATEARCTVAVKLRLGGKTVARKTLTVRGGSTRALDLRLSKAARSALAARSKVNVTAVITATDAAANQRTTQFRMTLRAPSH